MASDLLSIARSGVQAARIGLDVTAQNIANASSTGYVRRSAAFREVASSGGAYRIGDLSLSGVRLDGIVRNADAFRQAEVRRTESDVARASAEVSGLQNIESAIEQSGVFDAIVGFESSLQQLTQNPACSSPNACPPAPAQNSIECMPISRFFKIGMFSSCSSQAQAL